MQRYNRSEISEMINSIKIERVNNSIVTKFNDNVLKVANVSNRYEVFDICKYLNEKIQFIEQNFTIHEYSFRAYGGIQYLRLRSDEVEINGDIFYKTFFILNSTDRSRTLNFNVGLISKNHNFTIIVNNKSFRKKHFTGVTSIAEVATDNFNIESFDDQISNISNLIGHEIKLSDLRDIILNIKDNGDITDLNHKKFDTFKSNLIYLFKGKLSNDLRNLLRRDSNRIKEIPANLDINLDAYEMLKLYLSIFNNQDSHIIRNESERIMNMTKYMKRVRILNELLSE